MKAWWFSEDRTLPHGDGREVRLGITHKVEGEIIPCKNGLHASKRAIDALYHAPGNIVWRVELGDTIVEGGDKAAASERTYLSGGIDASDTLRKFARMCAQDVLHLWNAPEVVKRYLKTGDESLRAAAWDAAGVADWGAARAAARDARGARGARDAARFAAGVAARYAARDAAWDASLAAARERQNERLHRMLLEAIRREGRRG